MARTGSNAQVVRNGITLTAKLFTGKTNKCNRSHLTSTTRLLKRTKGAVKNFLVKTPKKRLLIGVSNAGKSRLLLRPRS